MRCTLEKSGLGYVVKAYAEDGFILHEKTFNTNFGNNYEAAKKYQDKIRSGVVKIKPRLDAPVVESPLVDQEKTKKSRSKKVDSDE